MNTKVRIAVIGSIEVLRFIANVRFRKAAQRRVDLN